VTIKITRLQINPRKRQKRKHPRAKRVHRVRKNPPSRTREYIVEALVRTRTKRFKTFYYDEVAANFTRNKQSASHYSKFQASTVARRLLPRVTDKVHVLRISSV